jgi:hypothetical protein
MMLTKKMTAEDFREWMLRMRLQRDWTATECSRRLGCGGNQVFVWQKTGAPRYIALACAALAFGLPPWRPPSSAEEPPKDDEVRAAE